jgi:hypothetical protein
MDRPPGTLRLSWGLKSFIKNAETDGTGDNGLALLAREEP